MRARLDVLCHEHCMVSALLYLQKSQKAGSDQDIIMTLFKLMRQVGAKEKKNQIK